MKNQPQTNWQTYWQRLILYAFHLLYNQLAWSYDLVSWLVSLGQWRSWQQAALPFLTGPHILELAHGPGHMLVQLKQAGCHITGFDLSPAMSRLAQQRLRKAGLHVPLVRGRAQSLPFAPAAFDSILATFPAQFIVMPQTLAALHRVLRPGGRLIIVPEAQLTTRSPLTRFIEFLFAITGQRQAGTRDHAPSALWHRAAERFETAGFTLTIEQVKQEKSIVTVVIAQKAVAGKMTP